VSDDDHKKNGASNGSAAIADEPNEEPGMVHTTPAEVRAASARRRRIVRPVGQPAADPEASDKPTDPPPEEQLGQRDPNIDSVLARHPDIEPENTYNTPPAAEPPPVRQPEPQRVEELCALLGDFSEGYIAVDRKRPESVNGRFCLGAMKPITRMMTHAEFGKIYGGGRYDLRIYRKKPSSVDDSGREIYKPWGAVMRIDIPIPPAPNLLAGIAASSEDEDEERSASKGARRLGQASNADARVHEANLAHEREARTYEDNRAEREEQKRKREVAEVERKSREEQNAAVIAIDRTADRYQEILQSQQREMREMRDKLLELTANGNKKDDADKAAAMVNSMGTMMNSMMAPLVAQMATKKDNGPELQTLMNEERRRADERIKDATDNAAIRIKDAETRASETIHRLEEQHKDRVTALDTQTKERITAVEARAGKDVEEAKRDADRRIADMTTRHTERIADIQRQHEAELRAKDTAWTMKLETSSASVEAKIESLKSDNRRLQHELDRARDEANKPITKRLAEITEAAEAIGLGRADAEPGDWKSMLMQMAMNVGSQLPDIMKSAGEAVRAVRSSPSVAQQQAFQADQAAQMQHAAQAQAAQLRPRFATEDSPLFEGNDVPRFAAAPQPPPVAPPITPPSAIQAPATTVAQPMVPMQPPVPLGVSTAPGAPAQRPNPSIPPPPATGPSVPDAQILQFREMFETAFKANADPGEVADHLIGQIGVPTMTQLLGMVDPVRINGALQRGGFSTSPLCRREGQKYLRAIWGKLRQLCKLS